VFHILLSLSLELVFLILDVANCCLFFNKLFNIGWTRLGWEVVFVRLRPKLLELIYPNEELLPYLLFLWFFLSLDDFSISKKALSKPKSLPWSLLSSASFSSLFYCLGDLECLSTCLDLARIGRDSGICIRCLLLIAAVFGSSLTFGCRFDALN
jgi:hypothetical protein